MKSIRINYPAVLAGILFIAAFWFVFGRAISGMVYDWEVDPNYSHGFLIPFISGYLVWQKREALARIEVDRSWFGLLVIAAGLGLFLVGSVAGESFTMRFSMLVVLGGTLLFAFGWGIFRELAFPYAFLIFMIPLPYILYDAIAFPLKLMITEYSVAVLKLFGVPVMREGNIIHLTSTTLEVADACSGIRSMISLLALSTAMAYFFLARRWKQIVLVALAIPIAMLANAIRVIGTGLLASRYGAGVAQGFFHEFAGLVIFAVAMVMLMISSAILSKIGGEK
ncbi:exosortase A [Geoalkalibacter subterraneus]|uniref:Exosortase n=1 Tax=Geoalkalibacter subterraneus TaxID=483547 RepID=A0A0B5FEK4_9BACT|nr:exosortase A [Geoalkalibacter subterraneus]AJF06532.1 hypothetical protein GSUB_08180 [Geoalkalibacter subterraneus]